MIRSSHIDFEADACFQNITSKSLEKICFRDTIFVETLIYDH